MCFTYSKSGADNVEVADFQNKVVLSICKIVLVRLNMIVDLKQTPSLAVVPCV